MTKARRLGVCTPVLYAVDPVQHTLTFEYVEGLSVKDIFLDFGSNGVVEERMDDIVVQIGAAIGKLHDGGLIHGDLTTSNMLIRDNANELASVIYTVLFCFAFDIYLLEGWHTWYVYRISSKFQITESIVIFALCPTHLKSKK